MNSSSSPGAATTRISHKLPIWQFADTNGSLTDGLGVRSPDGVAYRYTFVVDPDNVIQHIYATNLNVGRAPEGYAARARRPADRRTLPLQS